MLVTWKLRASPRRAMRYGRSPATSLPSSLIDPCEGLSRPLIKLKSVDLPAPLGPMIAWRSPSGTVSETPRMISVAPKLLRTPASSSAVSATGGRRAHGAPRIVHFRPQAPRHESADRHQRDRGEPRPRLRGVHRYPEELHGRARFRLRRAAIRHLDEEDRADRRSEAERQHG